MENGQNDLSFALGSVPTIPYFTPSQGGDYHVYPDGRVLLSGAHSVNYPQGGFTGTHHLIWFTNTGQLDTTRTHRKANAAIYKIHQLSDGRFLLSGVLTQYEGTPVGRILRVHPDGELDTTFHTSIYWGQAVGFHELPDGRVLAAGRFLFQNDPDTLHLVRLLPDGQLDNTFNNHLRSLYNGQFGPTGFYPWGGVFPIDQERMVVYGAFTSIDEQARGGIALVDTAGNLLDAPFGEGGCGQYLYDGSTLHGSIEGITMAPVGHYYIWGAYHGYDDGSTHDPLQRMVSRLYGLNVGVEEQQVLPWRVYPNPASTQLTVELEQVPPGAMLLLRDALGRAVRQEGISGHYHTLALQGLGGGLYLLEVWQGGKRLAAEKVVVE
ncbi:MAG: delta-60 repeat domain-containing protein [Flavobacteriales bacterium]|nr:delta-60 repeat domain-containing protein [Flavobacteriales bacterium]